MKPTLVVPDYLIYTTRTGDLMKTHIVCLTSDSRKCLDFMFGVPRFPVANK